MINRSVSDADKTAALQDSGPTPRPRRRLQFKRGHYAQGGNAAAHPRSRAQSPASVILFVAARPVRPREKSLALLSLSRPRPAPAALSPILPLHPHPTRRSFSTSSISFFVRPRFSIFLSLSIIFSLTIPCDSIQPDRGLRQLSQSSECASNSALSTSTLSIARPHRQ